MRAASLLPLLYTAALLTACRSEIATVVKREEPVSRPATLPARDLTLPAAAPRAVAVASPVEVSRSRPAPAVRPRPKPAPPPPSEARPEPEPLPEPLPEPEDHPQPVHPAPEPPEPAVDGGRELAPGQTVTIIPVSSGPAVEADEDDSWLPSERARGIIGRGGGTCRPRGAGRGIGIAGRIPVGVPTRRVR